MTMISAAAACAGDMRIDQLEAEFGAILAARIVEAEALDFYWEARVEERYLGQAQGLEEPDEDLVRVAIMSRLGGSWHVGTAVVDGEGCPVDLLWKRSFINRSEAENAYMRAH